MSPWLSDVFLRSQSDERLVNLARAGHDRAFVAIVERYRRRLHGLARRLNSDGRAEDIVQQTFLSAFTALREGVEVRHLSGWLHQILRNTAIRSAAGVPLEAEWDESPLPCQADPDTLERRILALSALAEVARLPRRQRDAFVGTAIHGHSRAEIASSMGLSEGAVRQLVHRARATVRGAVTAITPYPLADWLSTTRATSGADRVTEIVLGAGGASAAGVGLKLGAVIVSGVLTTGIVSSALQPRPAPKRAVVSGGGHRSSPAQSAAALPGGGSPPGAASTITVAIRPARALSPNPAPSRAAAAVGGRRLPASIAGLGGAGDGFGSASSDGRGGGSPNGGGDGGGPSSSGSGGGDGKQSGSGDSTGMVANDGPTSATHSADGTSGSGTVNALSQGGSGSDGGSGPSGDSGSGPGGTSTSDSATSNSGTSEATGGGGK